MSTDDPHDGMSLAEFIRDPNVRAWERLIIIGFSGLAVTLLLSLAGQTQDLRELAARLEERTQSMQGQLSVMNTQMRDRYTAGDARKDMSVRDELISELRTRVRRVEREVEAVKAKTEGQ